AAPQPLLYLEHFVPFERELAVMVTRDCAGVLTSYPCVVTAQCDNVCCLVVVPAQVSGAIAEQAERAGAVATAPTPLPGHAAVRRDSARKADVGGGGGGEDSRYNDNDRGDGYSAYDDLFVAMPDEAAMREAYPCRVCVSKGGNVIGGGSSGNGARGRQQHAQGLYNSWRGICEPESSLPPVTGDTSAAPAVVRPAYAPALAWLDPFGGDTRDPAAMAEMAAEFLELAEALQAASAAVARAPDWPDGGDGSDDSEQHERETWVAAARAAAAEWYWRAAEGGNARGMVVLGRLLMAGVEFCVPGSVRGGGTLAGAALAAASAVGAALFVGATTLSAMTAAGRPGCWH
ncbi:hypothetical protein HK405_007931, partial [Cladochytrium tenue]